jgi:hypothetical protein
MQIVATTIALTLISTPMAVTHSRNHDAIRKKEDQNGALP